MAKYTKKPLKSLPVNLIPSARQLIRQIAIRTVEFKEALVVFDVEFGHLDNLLDRLEEPTELFQIGVGLKRLLVDVSWMISKHGTHFQSSAGEQMCSL